MTLKIVPKKFGSMVFPWHGHDVCYSLDISGMYTCYADNGAGLPAQATVTLEVQCKFERSKLDMIKT